MEISGKGTKKKKGFTRNSELLFQMVCLVLVPSSLHDCLKHHANCEKTLGKRENARKKNTVMWPPIIMQALLHNRHMKTVNVLPCRKVNNCCHLHFCFKKDKHGILEEVTIENKKKVKKKDFIRHCPGPEKN